MMNKAEQQEFDETKAAVECLTRGLIVAHRNTANLVQLLNEVCAQANDVLEDITIVVNHAFVRHGAGRYIVEEDADDRDARPTILDLIGAVFGRPQVEVLSGSREQAIAGLAVEAGGLADKAARGGPKAEEMWRDARDKYNMARFISTDENQRTLFKQQSGECHKRMLETRMDKEPRRN